MSPDGLLTVMAPSEMVHLAGDLSRAVTHSSRWRPSNSTTASEGASALLRPGVMTRGTGVQTSVSSGFGRSTANGGLEGFCADAGAVTTSVAATTVASRKEAR